MSGAGGDDFHDLGLVILLAHLLENDGVPGGISLLTRHIVFARPPAQAQFLDKIQLDQYTTSHDLFPQQHELGPPNTSPDSRSITVPCAGARKFPQIA